MQNEKEWNQFKLQFLRFVPELLHASVGSERPEECRDDECLFRCAPCAVFCLVLVLSVDKKCDDVYCDVACRSDDEVIHEGLFLVFFVRRDDENGLMGENSPLFPF